MMIIVIKKNLKKRKKRKKNYKQKSLVVSVFLGLILKYIIVIHYNTCCASNF